MAEDEAAAGLEVETAENPSVAMLSSQFEDPENSGVANSDTDEEEEKADGQPTPLDDADNQASESGVGATKEMRALFNSIDTDGGGSLDRDEIAQLCVKMGVTMSDAELDEAMAEMDEDGGGEVEFEEFRDWWVAQMDTSGGQRSKFATAVAEIPDEPPESGCLLFCGLGCFPCIGYFAYRETTDVKMLHANGDYAVAIHQAKRGRDIGFIAVVLGTMFWMVIYGMLIKPLFDSEPDCKGWPNCVPDDWVEPHTTDGRL